MSLGSQRCSYDADVKMLDGVNLKTLLLAIPTLGFSRAWYRAALLNAKYNNLRAGNIYFNAHFSGGALLRLGLGNMLILICTLFIGMPIVIQRMMRYFSNNVQILGTFEGSTILQVDGKAGNLGEGIEDSFSTDGLDFDMGVL